MFEYAKQDLEKKIQVYGQKWNEKKKEEEMLENSISQINQCLIIKREQRYTLSLIVGSLLISGVSFVGTIHNSLSNFLSMDSTFVNGLCYVITGIGGFCVINGSIDFFRAKYTLQNNYPEYAHFDTVKLLVKRNEMSNQQYQSYCEATRHGNHLRTLQKEEGKISHFEEVKKEMDSMSSNLYYLAKDYEDYQRLLSMKEYFFEQFDKFLNEPVDPSTVHFNETILTSVQYVKK